MKKKGSDGKLRFVPAGERDLVNARLINYGRKYFRQPGVQLINEIDLEGCGCGICNKRFDMNDQFTIDSKSHRFIGVQIIGGVLVCPECWATRQDDIERVAKNKMHFKSKKNMSLVR